MMARRDGFALVAVLWLILLLSALGSAGIAPVVVEQRAAENRVALGRAGWAALACLELLRARVARGTEVQESLDSIALGASVWCDAESMNVDERVNVNVADSAGLQRVLGDPGRVAALLDWIDEDDLPRAAGAEAEWYRAAMRPLPRNAPLRDPSELALVRGFEAIAPDELYRVFTTRGLGRVSPNRAPSWALGSVSVLSEQQIERVVALRTSGATFAAAEQVTVAAGLDPTIPEFRDLTQRLSFNESEHTVVVSGRVSLGERTLESRLVVVLIETDGELVVSHVVAR